MKIVPVIEDFAGIAAAMKDPGLPEGAGVEAPPRVQVADDYPGIAAAVRGLEAKRAASWRRFTEDPTKPQPVPLKDAADYAVHGFRRP